MLLITRKEDEIVNLYTTDGVIKIHIKSFRNGQVRIGVDAPMTVQIMRDEIDDGLAAFSDAKNAFAPHSQLQKMHRSLVSRIIHSGINFLNRQFNTSPAKCTQ
jgi:carbon storage regulator CsrA